MKIQEELNLMYKVAKIKAQIRNVQEKCTLKDLNEIFQNIAESYPQYFDNFVQDFWRNFNRSKEVLL